MAPPFVSSGSSPLKKPTTASETIQSCSAPEWRSNMTSQRGWAGMYGRSSGGQQQQPPSSMPPRRIDMVIVDSDDSEDSEDHITTPTRPSSAGRSPSSMTGSSWLRRRSAEGLTTAPPSFTPLITNSGRRGTERSPSCISLSDDTSSLREESSGKVHETRPPSNSGQSVRSSPWTHPSPAVPSSASLPAVKERIYGTSRSSGRQRNADPRPVTRLETFGFGLIENTRAFMTATGTKLRAVAAVAPKPKPKPNSVNRKPTSSQPVMKQGNIKDQPTRSIRSSSTMPTSSLLTAKMTTSATGTIMQNSSTPVTTTPPLNANAHQITASAGRTVVKQEPEKGRTPVLASLPMRPFPGASVDDSPSVPTVKRPRTGNWHSSPSVGTCRDPYAISSDSDSDSEDGKYYNNNRGEERQRNHPSKLTSPKLPKFIEFVTPDKATSSMEETASDVEAALNLFPTWLETPSPPELSSSSYFMATPTPITRKQSTKLDSSVVTTDITAAHRVSEYGIKQDENRQKRHSVPISDQNEDENDSDDEPVVRGASTGLLPPRLSPAHRNISIRSPLVSRGGLVSLPLDQSKDIHSHLDLESNQNRNKRRIECLALDEDSDLDCDYHHLAHHPQATQPEKNPIPISSGSSKNKKRRTTCEDSSKTEIEIKTEAEGKSHGSNKSIRGDSSGSGNGSVKDGVSESKIGKKKKNKAASRFRNRDRQAWRRCVRQKKREEERRRRRGLI